MCVCVYIYNTWWVIAYLFDFKFYRYALFSSICTSLSLLSFLSLYLNLARLHYKVSYDNFNDSSIQLLYICISMYELVLFTEKFDVMLDSLVLLRA